MIKRTAKGAYLILLLALAPACAQTELKTEYLPLDQAIREVSEDQAALPALYSTVKEIYLRQGKMDKALSLLETYNRNNGSDQGLLNALAYLYEQSGAPAKAAALYERMLVLNSVNAQSVRPKLIALYIRLGTLDKARDLTELELKREPDNPLLLRQFAKVQLDRKDFYGAEDSYKKLLKLKPVHYDYILLADVYMEQKKTDKAVEILEEGISKFPGSEVDLRTALANIHMRLGDKTKALLILNDVLWKVNEPQQKENIRQLIRNYEGTPAPGQPAAQSGVITPP
ncbi:MAG TPA: tetratricopeptide repeat protein [Elusimicrobiales bacterium]|nr:tetratricopeptide repeat protein [Elusimicrobiales bacterium]